MFVLYVETVSKSNPNRTVTRDFFGPFESMVKAEMRLVTVKENVVANGLCKITKTVIAKLIT